MKPASRLLASLASLAVSTAASVAHAEGSDITFRARTEVTAYKDNDATNVLTPGLRAEIENVPSGWAIGASLLVDVVTTASADVVSTASPAWTDIRYVPGLDARFKISDVTLSIAGGGSIESDYYAGSGTVGVAIDTNDKLITPSFSYGFGYDLASRRHTPLSVYSLELMRHSLATHVSFVVNKSTIFMPGISAVLELGDQEKPYRYLPTFTEGTEVPNGATRHEVNQLRTSVRLAENTPDLRHRYAGSALIAHRWDNATVRVEERLYIDSWMLMATTTDATIPIDLGTIVRIWPHLRFHAQKGVDFWQRAYVVNETSQGVEAPQLRAGDRELGPMIAATAGGGIRLGGDHVGLTMSADAIYTRFLDHLFITNRIAGFGALVFDAEVD
ncbi:MAG: DUF3570 domain-containing protein [Polyangiaceae bacterium]|jgi:hypothetical protein|nr:DUF3570 domain-containing protein [Polyangiaceae bacterium]